MNHLNAWLRLEPLNPYMGYDQQRSQYLSALGMLSMGQMLNIAQPPERPADPAGALRAATECWDAQWRTGFRVGEFPVPERTTPRG